MWTYRDQRADRVAGVGLLAAEASAASEPIRGISGDGTAALEMIAALGCRIDGGGSHSEAVHPDADLTHALVGRCLGRELLIANARRASRPDWRPGARHRAVPADRDRRGRANVVYNGPNHGEVMCPIMYLDAPDEIASRGATIRLGARRSRIFTAGSARTRTAFATTRSPMNCRRRHRGMTTAWSRSRSGNPL